MFGVRGYITMVVMGWCPVGCEFVGLMKILQIYCSSSVLVIWMGVMKEFITTETQSTQRKRVGGEL